MATYIKVAGELYPAEINGSMADYTWDGRESKSITLTMSHDEVRRCCRTARRGALYSARLRRARAARRTKTSGTTAPTRFRATLPTTATAR